MTTATFTDADLVWPEISVYVEAALSRWPLDDYATNLGDVDIHGVQCPCVVLLGAGTLWHALRTFQPSGKRPTQYSFVERQPSAKDDEYSVAYEDPFYTNLPQIVFGHAFEKLRMQAHTRWGERKNWPNIFQVGYHIRNGSFHGNQFNFTVTIHGTPSWRGLTITQQLQGSTVMSLSSGLLAFGDIPILLYELLEELRTT